MFLDEHRCGNFHQCLSVDVVRVNPKTERIEKRAERNTATRVWLECGPWIWPSELSEEAAKYAQQGIGQHDLDLDCGGDTFEDAVLTLAKKVFEKYGTKYRRAHPFKRLRPSRLERMLERQRCKEQANR